MKREAFATAANNAADMIIDELELDEQGVALTNLLVNAALTLADEPDFTLDQIIEHNYDDPPEEVRSWCTTDY